MSAHLPVYLVDQKGLQRFLFSAEMVELNRDQYEEELKSPETILKEMFILGDA